MVIKSKPKIVRNDRNTLFADQRSLAKAYFNGKDAQIINISNTGACISNGGKPQIGKGYNIEIHFAEYKIISCSADVIWIDGDKIGLKFTDSTIPVGVISALNKVSDSYNKITTETNAFEKLPPAFICELEKFKIYIKNVKDQLDSIDSFLEIENIDFYDNAKRIIKDVLFPQLAQKLISYSKAFDDMRSTIFKDEIKDTVIDLFKKEVLPIMVDGSFPKRALNKPRGYAGDSEMMNQIYRHDAEGRTLFAAFMHYYAINEPSGFSVRYRRGFFTSQIEKTIQTNSQATIVALACGPAVEIAKFLEKTTDHLEGVNFVLLDQDKAALLDAKKNIDTAIEAKNIKCNFHYIPLSVRDIVARDGMKNTFHDDVQFDLIYTAGLYDYLDQPLAVMLTGQLTTKLRKGGSLFIGNFSVSLPSKTMLELFLDWHLIYRNREEMLSLASDSFRKTLHVDDTGHQWILEISQQA